MSKNVVLKETGKKNFKGAKTYNLYIKNVPCYYASVLKPKLKHNSQTEKEYAITVFVDDEMRDYLEDEIMINKTLCKVGVDKNQKKKIKYPKDKFPLVEGLNGFVITKDEKTKEGKKMFINVLKKEDDKAVKMTDLVGNGSTVTVKCYAYYNEDELLIVKLDTVLVEDLVEYEGGGAVVDDELGVSYEIQFPDEEDTSEKSSGDSDEVPFDSADDYDDEY